MKPTNVYKELQRRNVFKVATVYAIAAWLIIQVAATIFPRLNFPEWTVAFIIILLAIGFPIALILAWVFEVTPEGLKKPNMLNSKSPPFQKRAVK